LSPQLSSSFLEWRTLTEAFIDPEKVKTTNDFRNVVQTLAKPAPPLAQFVVIGEYLDKIFKSIGDEDWSIDPGNGGLYGNFTVGAGNAASLPAKRLLVEEVKQAVLRDLKQSLSIDMVCSLLGAQLTGPSYDLNTAPRDTEAKLLATWCNRSNPNRDVHLNLIAADNNNPSACFSQTDITVRHQKRERDFSDRPLKKRFKRVRDGQKSEKPILKAHAKNRGVKTAGDNSKSTKQVVGFEKARCYNCNLLGHTAKQCDQPRTEKTAAALSVSSKKTRVPAQGKV
jgi:hypothetical protein